MGSILSGPQLQLMCCYKTRYYVKIMHLRLGVIKYIPTKLGVMRNIVDPNFAYDKPEICQSFALTMALKTDRQRKFY